MQLRKGACLRGDGGLVSVNELRAFKTDDDSFGSDENIDVPIVILTGHKT